MASKGKKGGRKGKSGDVDQYLADDILEEKEQKGGRGRKRQQMVEEDDEEDEFDQINIDDARSKEDLKRQNMDKIADILVHMLLKNVSLLNPKSPHDGLSAS